MTSSEIKRRWRKNNPEKVKGQQERRRARQAAMSDADQEILRKKRREYLRQYREAHKNDEDMREKSRLRARVSYRAKHGLPLTGALVRPSRKILTDEERRAKKAEAKRRAYAKKLGLTIEQIAARKLEREAATAEKKRLQAEDIGKRYQRTAEANAAAARAAKRMVPSLPKKAHQPPEISPDPPELVALFAKASKGEPPRPHNPHGRKASVFQFRGSIIQPRRI